MSLFGKLLRETWENPGITQRDIAAKLRVSLGKCNMLVKQAIDEGLIDSATRRITDSGMEYLGRFRVSGAILLASGIDLNFIPFAKDTPKPLMRVEGERIIERLIRQLRESGIERITIVAGYMAERFDYLVDKYDVELVLDTEYATKTGLSSLHHVIDRLENSYIIPADLWIWHNLFHIYEPHSWCACSIVPGETRKLCVTVNSAGCVTDCGFGGKNQLAVTGPFFISKVTAQLLRPIIDIEYIRGGLLATQWERLFSSEVVFAQIYANEIPSGVVHEFNSFEELKGFGTLYAESLGNGHLSLITSIFGITESEITDIQWLDMGMASVNLFFTMRGERFIYRVPPEDSLGFFPHRQEAAAYKAVAHLKLSDETAYMDSSAGIKITRHYPGSRSLDIGDPVEIAACLAALRALHSSGARVRYVFDIEERLKFCIAACAKAGCIHFEDFDQTVESIGSALDAIKDHSGARVLCHLSPSAGSFLFLADASVRLLDWNMSAMCHREADIAAFALFLACTGADFDALLETYYGRPATEAEKKLCVSYAAAMGLLWCIWAEYQKHTGKESSQLAVTMYRLCKHYTTQLRAMSGLEPEPPDRQIATPVTRRSFESAKPLPALPYTSG